MAAPPPKPERPESLSFRPDAANEPPPKPTMPSSIRNSEAGRPLSTFSRPTIPDNYSRGSVRPGSNGLDFGEDELPVNGLGGGNYQRPVSTRMPSSTITGKLSTFGINSVPMGMIPAAAQNYPSYYVPPSAAPPNSGDSMFKDFEDEDEDVGEGVEADGDDVPPEIPTDGQPIRPAMPTFMGRGSISVTGESDSDSGSENRGADYVPAAMPPRPNLPKLEFDEDSFEGSSSAAHEAAFANDIDTSFPGMGMGMGMTAPTLLPAGSYINQTESSSNNQIVPGMGGEQSKSQKALAWIRKKVDEATDLTQVALEASGITSKEQAKANQYVKATVERVRANDPSLIELQISSCKVSTDRLKQLRDALKSNNTIKKIDASKMGLANCEESVHILSKALHTNSSVTWLDLKNNKIGMRTCKAVMDLLKTNLNITRVDIQERVYEAESRVHLLRSLQTIQWLMHMNFQYQLFRAGKHRNLMLAGRDFKQITQRLLEFAENVSYFDISFNELENFPDFISEMIHVQFFIANHNHLNYLEGRFFQTFEKLVRLDLAFNKLVQIPEEITEIATLQELYLNDNQLTDISELIRLLSNLRRVNLANNQLTKLPQELSNLIHLEYLNVSNNQIVFLPESLMFLVGLRYLDLSKNQLIKLPEEQPNLPNLEILLLNNNEIGRLPDYIGLCTNIRKIDLSFNKLIALPEEITQLRLMEELYIHNNFITHLPEKVGSLWRLTKLDAHVNKITALPIQLQLLKYLSHLDLSYNKLKKLDDFLCTLVSLSDLKLQKNEPLKGMPKSILEKGDEEVLTFVQQLPYQWITQARMKLMVVGKEKSGKSSLVDCFAKKLSKSKKKGKEQSVINPTEGITVSDLSVTKSNYEIQYSVYDFSGKEEYYNTHQLFFSERAIYVLVCNMLDPDDDDEIIENWLQMIEIKTTARVPIFIVGTRLDEKACGTKQKKNFFKRIKSRFNDRFNIVGYEAVSASQNKKVDTLIEKIIKVTLQQPKIPENLNKAYEYLESRTRLLRHLMRTPMTSFKRFREEVLACGIRAENVGECMTWLHNAGIVTYFPNCPSLVFLNSQWVIDLVSSFNKIKRFVKRGMVDRSEFLQIWNTEEYPEKYHEYILMLLERFELLMRLKDQGKIFFPELLEEEPLPTQSTLNMMWNPGYEMDQPEFRRVFKLHFIPQFMFARIIGRLMYGMGWELQNYYKNVAIVNKESLDEGDTSAFLRIDPGEKTFSITMRGETAADKILQIIRLIDQTVEQMHLSSQSFVPCTHCLLLEEGKKPYLFPLKEFETAEGEGKGYVLCRGEVAVKLRALLPHGTLKPVVEEEEEDDEEEGEGEGGGED